MSLSRLQKGRVRFFSCRRWAVGRHPTSIGLRAKRSMLAELWTADFAVAKKLPVLQSVWSWAQMAPAGSTDWQAMENRKLRTL
jgi:hypothetical protein